MTLYCERTDIELAFGVVNVAIWADVDNNKDADSIAARIDWAIEQASDEFDNKTRATPIQAKLADPAPPMVVRMVAYLAGVLLYESRGVTDMDEKGNPRHQLSWAKQRFDRFIQDVAARRIVLADDALADDALQTTDIPGFVSLDDPSDDCEESIITQGFVDDA